MPSLRYLSILLLALAAQAFILNKTVILKTDVLPIDAVFKDRLLFTSSPNFAKQLLLPQCEAGKAVILDASTHAYTYSEANLSYFYKSPSIPNEISFQPGSPILAKLNTAYPITQILLNADKSMLFAFASDPQTTPYQPYGMLYVFDTKKYQQIAAIDLTNFSSDSANSLRDISDKWESLDLNEDGSVLILIQGGYNIFYLDTQTFKIFQHETLKLPTSTARFSKTINGTTYVALCGGTEVSLYTRSTANGSFVPRRNLTIAKQNTALECSVSSDFESYFSLEFNQSDATLSVVKRDLTTLQKLGAISYPAVSSINLTRPHYHSFSRDQNQLALVADQGVKIIDLLTFKEKGKIDTGFASFSSTVFSTTNTQLGVINKVSGTLNLYDSVTYQLLLAYELPEYYIQVLLDDSTGVLYISTPSYLSAQKLESQEINKYNIDEVSDIKSLAIIKQGTVLLVAGSVSSQSNEGDGVIVMRNAVQTIKTYPLIQVPLKMVVSKMETMVAVELSSEIRITALEDGRTVAVLPIGDQTSKMQFSNQDRSLVFNLKNSVVVLTYHIDKQKFQSITYPSLVDFTSAATKDIVIALNRSTITLFNSTSSNVLEYLDCQDKYDQLSLVGYSDELPAVYSWNKAQQIITTWRDQECPAGEYNQRGLCTCAYGRHRDESNTCVCDDFRHLVSAECVCDKYRVDVGGVCICEPGRRFNGTDCVCDANRYLDPTSNKCLCKQSWIDVGGQCVCDIGRVLKNNICVCEDGRFEQGSQCICKANRTLFNDHCVCEYGRSDVAGDCLCSANRIDINGTCQCKDGKVDDKTGGCICGPEEVFKDGRCQCQFGYFLADNSCQKCSPICSSCDGSSSSCTIINPMLITACAVGGALLVVVIVLSYCLVKKSKQKNIKSQSLLESHNSDQI